MLLFYGLGNFGREYEQTRHNAGRLVLEKIAASLDTNFSRQNNYFSAKKNLPDLEETLILLYSSGFMNHSGRPLLEFLQYFKPNLKETLLLVLQDDSDQISGKQKLSLGGGSAGHKGIDSIYQEVASLGLKKEQVWRLKIGIRPPENRLKSETFVLKDFGLEELKQLDLLAKKVENLLPQFGKRNLPLLQNSLNTNGF